MTRAAVILRWLSVICIIFLLSGCAAMRVADAQKHLRIALVQCRSEFPIASKGNSVARSECFSSAEDRYLRPIYPYGDLLDLRQAYRLAIASQVDSGRLSLIDANLKFAEVNTEIASIAHQRQVEGLEAQAAHSAAMGNLLAGLAAMQQASRPTVPYPSPPRMINTNCIRAG